jgi:hypothetical protein
MVLALLCVFGTYLRTDNTSEQTATFVLYSINWLDFITVVKSVYSAVRTDPLYKAEYV